MRKAAPAHIQVEHSADSLSAKAKPPLPAHSEIRAQSRQPGPCDNNNPQQHRRIILFTMYQGSDLLVVWERLVISADEAVDGRRALRGVACVDGAS